MLFLGVKPQIVKGVILQGMFVLIRHDENIVFSPLEDSLFSWLTGCLQLTKDTIQFVASVENAI